MKKLLFAGPSMIAGDEFMWKSFCDEFNVTNRKYPPEYITIEDERVVVKYHWDYKRAFNMAAQCAKILNTQSIDISVDGYSNTSVAFSIINYLSKLSEEEKKNIHVVAGWADVGVFTKYDELDKKFVDISVWWIEHLKKGNNKELYRFVSNFYEFWHDNDMIIDYIRSLCMVESFLKTSMITYTFIKTVGPTYDISKFSYLDDENFKFMFSNQDNYDSYILHKKYLKSPIIDLNNISDEKRWVVFDENNKGWNGESWRNILYKTKPTHDSNGIFLENSFVINENNHHPNLETIIEFSEILSNKILIDVI